MTPDNPCARPRQATDPTQTRQAAPWASPTNAKFIAPKPHLFSTGSVESLPRLRFPSCRGTHRSHPAPSHRTHALARHREQTHRPPTSASNQAQKFLPAPKPTLSPLPHLCLAGHSPHVRPHCRGHLQAHDTNVNRAVHSPGTPQCGPKRLTTFPIGTQPIMRFRAPAAGHVGRSRRFAHGWIGRTLHIPMGANRTTPHPALRHTAPKTAKLEFLLS